MNVAVNEAADRTAAGFRLDRPPAERAEVLRRGAGAQGHQSLRRPQRDRRPDRRQRRRQVDADQGDDRRVRARPPAASSSATRRSISPTISVRGAHSLSIETVYQDKSLAEKQPLWRNFFVGRQITNRFGFIDIKREKEIAQQILIDVIGFRGVGITVDSTISNLSGGERQGIAIGRAMHYNADLIVLDEPTAALGVAEVRKVIDFVQTHQAVGTRLRLHRAQPRPRPRGRRPPGRARPRLRSSPRSFPRTCR